MKYTVFLNHVATGDIFELPFDSINYVEELNNGSTATFNLDWQTINDQVALPYSTTVISLFTAVLSEMWVEDENGNKLWFGLVVDYKRTKDATGSNKLAIACADYFAVFQKRRTAADKSYIAVDPATIPWDLINTSQGLTSGNLGITVGATASTGLTVSPDYKRVEIKQTISDLSNYKVQNSFDFDIDYTKKLNIYYPTKGSLRSNVVFDDSNILGVTVEIPLLLNMTNSIFVRGQGVNSDVPEVNVQASAPVVAEYTLLEDVYSDTTTSDTTILTNEGNLIITLQSLPLTEITLKHDEDTDLTTYGLGDKIIVDLPEEGISYAQYRVKKRTVDLDVAGTLIATLDLLTV